MKVTINTNEQVTSLSRRRKRKSKGKSARSTMLKTIMPLLSGTHGEELARAVKNKDGNMAQIVMNELGKELREELHSQR